MTKGPDFEAADAEEIRRRYRSTTPAERLQQAFGVSRFAARLRNAGARARTVPPVR